MIEKSILYRQTKMTSKICNEHDIRLIILKIRICRENENFSIIIIASLLDLCYYYNHKFHNVNLLFFSI